MGLSIGYFESLFYKTHGSGCVYMSDMEYTETEPIKTNTHGPTSAFGWGCNVTLAYRYQMMKGAFFRAGVTDNFNLVDTDYYIASGYSLAPFLSFGISF